VGAPPAKPSAETIEVVRRLSTLLLLVTLLGIVLLVALALIVLQRMRERAQAAMLPKAKSEPVVSAWEEAGRRLVVPPREGPDQPDVHTDEERDAESKRAREAEDAARAPDTSPPWNAAPAFVGSSKPSDRPVVLVTGGARRVGRAIVLEFARSGFDVVFTYNRSEGEAHELTQFVTQLGRQATSHRVNFDDIADVEQFGEQLAQTMSRLDVLVHNAGSYGGTPLADLDAATLMKHLRVNAASPLLLTAKLRPLLASSRLAGGASVIAMCDMHAMGRPRRNHAAYLMSKAALTEMVSCLARDLAPQVRVNGVAPGVVAWEEPGAEPPEGSEFDSKGSDDRPAPGLKPTSEEEQRRYLRRVPLGRFGQPEEAARVVRWLATEATYVTGQVVRVDGGRWLA
jgi:pteridine reductase